MTDEQLSALLRLKRYEQPPPHYFDRLLQAVNRRQRAELLQRSVWKIAFERVQTFFGERGLGPLSYAAAMGIVLVAGAALFGLRLPSGEVPDHAGAGAALAVSHPDSPGPEKLLSISTNSPSPKLDAQPLQSARQELEPMVYQPRYVMDVRPVSYEPSSSFNF